MSSKIDNKPIVPINVDLENDFNVFVGQLSGVTKGIKLTKKKCVQKSLQKMKTITKNDIVTSMNFANEAENEILLACGTQDTLCYKIYDTYKNAFVKHQVCNFGNGKVVGIFKNDGNIITAAESGHVKSWDSKNEEKLLFEAGEKLNRMKFSNKNKIVATGGEENPLKVFDLSTRKQIFSAKNVAHDFLQMRVPVSIKDLGFFSDDEKQIVTVGKYGHVRTYDMRKQRRPIVNLEIKDESLTTLCVVPGKEQIIVGSGKGRMKLLDLRAPGKAVSVFKGAVGSITSISLAKNQPFVVSVGLDRFLRVHNFNTKEETRKAYLTSKATCLLIKSDFSLDDEDEVEVKVELEEKPEELEELFENLEEVEPKAKKQKKVHKFREKGVKCE